MSNWLIAIAVLVVLGSFLRESSFKRWKTRVVNAREAYSQDHELFPKWRFIKHFATPERQNKCIFFYYKDELADELSFMPKQYVSIPSYFFSPSMVYVNDFSEIASVDLIYTEEESYEEMRKRLKEIGVWEEFEIVQRYGDFQLLERRVQSP